MAKRLRRVRAMTRRVRKLAARRALLSSYSADARFAKTTGRPPELKASKVYQAVKDQMVADDRLPFDPDNKLKSPPCRFTSDTLGPFTRRVAKRLQRGSAPLELEVGDRFEYAGYADWEAFIGKMLEGDARNLIVTIATLTSWR
jgi:hypothetical protein